MTIRLCGKEYFYNAEWSKYPPGTEPVYEPLKDALREVAKYLRRKLNPDGSKPRTKRLLARIGSFFTNRTEQEKSIDE